MTQQNVARQPRTTSPSRLVMAALIGLAFAPVAGRAAVIDGTAAVELQVVEREGGADQGMHALVYLESRYLIPMEGNIELTVNGVMRKAEPVATDSKVLIDIPLGPMARPINACVSFGGVLVLGGDNVRSTQASDCDHLPLVAPPGFRGESTLRPRLARLPSPVRLAP